VSQRRSHQARKRLALGHWPYHYGVQVRFVRSREPPRSVVAHFKSEGAEMGLIRRADVVRRGTVAKSRLLVGRLGAFVVVTAVLVAAGVASAAGSGWSIQRTPNPTAATSGASLGGVACASSTACIAVGDYGNGAKVLTLAERWNGKRWSIQHTPDPAGAYSVFTGVSCASRSACTAVGFSNTPTANPTLVEHWNGTRWFIQDTPNPAGRQSVLEGVSCASRSACIAVGGSPRPPRA
jgi:hypothetical protein